MPGTNDFLPFGTGGSALVISNAAYLALVARGTGFQNGVAEASQLNKTWRQGSVMAAMLGQFIATLGNENALDNGDEAALLAAFLASLNAVAQNVPRTIIAYTTAGANNYTVPNNVYRVRIRSWGGGGGGGGNQTSGAGAGGGGGGYAEAVYAVSPGGILAFSVGIAGTAGSNSGGSQAANKGGNGGNTTYTAGGMTAAGGGGGQGSTTANQGVSGAAGVGSGGSINIRGTDGMTGFWSGSFGLGGAGGSSPCGGGGGSASTGLPSTGGNYGGGGGGGAGTFAGGPGGVGAIVVEA